MTPDQIKAIHVLKNRAGLNDQAYRLLLRNVAHVDSCKELTNDQFEQCMALLEESMESQGASRSRYWRDKLSSPFANPRMVWKITQLFADYRIAANLAGVDPADAYQLPGLVERASSSRTRFPEKLTPREAWNLIEQLKQMVTRTRHDVAHPPRSSFNPRSMTGGSSSSADPIEDPVPAIAESEIPF